MVPRLTLLLVLVAVLGSAGCGKAPRLYPGPPEAVFGTGLFSFTPIADCQRVPIIHGIQGGYHFWGSLRLRYMGFERVKVKFTVMDLTGKLIEYPAAQVPGNPISTVLDLDALDATTLAVGGTSDGSTASACSDGGVPRSDGGNTTIPDGIDGWGEYLGATVFMPLSMTPLPDLAMGGTDGGGQTGPLVTLTVDGKPIRVRMEATDTDGRMVSNERTLVPYQYY